MKSHSLFCFNGVISLTCSPFIAYAFLYRFSMNLISFMFLVCAILAIFIYKKEENGRKKSFLFLLAASITGFVPFLSIFSAIFAFISGILYIGDFNKLAKKIK